MHLSMQFWRVIHTHTAGCRIASNDAKTFRNHCELFQLDLFARRRHGLARSTRSPAVREFSHHSPQVVYQLCEPALYRSTYLHTAVVQELLRVHGAFCDVILGGHLSSKYYGYCVQQVQRLQLVPLTDAATRDVSADIALH